MTYSEKLSTAAGPIQYIRLGAATNHYEKFGFRYIDVPWLVQQKVDHATKPKHVKPIHHHVSALNHTFHFAASGEQSFIQMQYDNAKNGLPEMQGRYQTITPCYRDEAKIDDQRRIGFMKLELIDWTTPTIENLDSIIDAAWKYFSKHLAVRVIANEQTYEHGVDIVSDKLGIELGSYGIRHNKIGDYFMSWTYATGLAEPRLSYAIEKERDV